MWHCSRASTSSSHCSRRCVQHYRSAQTVERGACGLIAHPSMLALDWWPWDKATKNRRMSIQQTRLVFAIRWPQCRRHTLCPGGCWAAPPRACTTLGLHPEPQDSCCSRLTVPNRRPSAWAETSVPHLLPEAAARRAFLDVDFLGPEAAAGAISSMVLIVPSTRCVVIGSVPSGRRR